MRFSRRAVAVRLHPSALSREEPACGKEDKMIFALAVGIGLFAGGVLVVARWRGQVAVRRELGAAARRVRGGSLDKEHGRKHAGHEAPCSSREQGRAAALN